MPSEFRVTNPRAPRLCVDPDMAHRAEELRADAAEGTPVRTGRLRASWQVSREGTASYQVTSDVPYARFVEYGTSDTPPAAMMGRALAKQRRA